MPASTPPITISRNKETPSKLTTPFIKVALFKNTGNNNVPNICFDP